MGWSCRREASETMNRWTAACIAQTNSQNEFEVNGERFFWDVSRTEHDDGAITGTIHRTLKVGEVLRGGHTVQPGETYCRKVATFRIDGDGKVKRAPKFLKDAAKCERKIGDLELRREVSNA